MKNEFCHFDHEHSYRRLNNWGLDVRNGRKGFRIIAEVHGNETMTTTYARLR